MQATPTTPNVWRAIIQLMRLHQPVGNWLLFWPCAWALALVGQGQPDVRLLALCAVGAVVMRSAGCIVNDLWDRDFDGLVARTASRPLVSGALSVKQAVAVLFVLLSIAAAIAFQLRIEALYLAVASLPLVAAYPFMKRLTWWPQLFLGLTFNWGALLASMAALGEIPLSAWLLYLGGIFWTLGYDTIYAMQDMKDDEKIGVKSTARLFANHTSLAVGGFYLLALLAWALAGFYAHVPLYYDMALLAVAYSFYQQIQQADAAQPALCGAAFRANVLVGWLMFLGLLTGVHGL